MDFAPYQDATPSTERALSPPPQNSQRSPTPISQSSPRHSSSTLAPPPRNNGFAHGVGSNSLESGSSMLSGGNGGDRGHINEFETSLPVRLDYEAMIAYLLLPPLGGALLLLLEHKSDYVRFHAWQSSLLFATIFIAHLILSFSAVLSWMLAVVDLILMCFLAWHAWRDADALDRFEVPFFGHIASSLVDDE